MFIDNICMGPISFACVQAYIYKTRNDDDRHTCAYLFIVVVHQLKRFLLTLSLLLLYFRFLGTCAQCAVWFHMYVFILLLGWTS